MKKIIIIYIAAFSILCLFKKTAICQNIGDNIHGGIVFYLNGNGGGLVALKTATAGAVNASWGCRGTIVNAGGTAIGTGYSNTVNILSGCTTPGIFADIISQLTHEGYSDWYMPSKDELQEIRDVFWGNGFNTYFAQSPNGHYDHITSSEASSETAWRLNCSNNVWEANWKDATNFGTIPIRGFGTMMPVMGCTDPTACNYNASANVDDGSCELPDGCTDSLACNYDSLATCDNNTCIYANTDSSSVIECDSYTWDGVVYISSGAYTNVYTNIAGCDSTHTLNLTINNSNTGSTSATSCDSYTWDGVVYTSSGAYTNVYTNAAGCDSVHTLNLTIDRSSISDYNQLLILTEEHEDHGHMHMPTTEGYNEETNKLKTFDLNQNSILYYDPTELENIESTTYNVLNNKVYALSEHDDTTYIVSIDKNANIEIDFLSSWDNTLVEYIEIEAYKNHLYLISTYNDTITFEEQIIFSKYNINTKTLTQINVLDTVDHYESEGTTFSDYNSSMYTVYTDDEKGSLISIDTLGSYQVIYEADGYISAIEAVGEKIYMIIQEGGGVMCANCYLELLDGNGGAKTWEITNSSGGEEFCGQELANAESNTFYFTINPGDSLLDDFGSTYLYAGEYGPGTTDSLGSLYEVHCEDDGAHMHTPTTEGYNEETYSLYIYNTITDTIENIYLLDSTLYVEDPISTYSRIDKKIYVKTEDDDNQLVFSIDSLGQTQLVYIDSASGIEFIEAHTKTTPQLEICDNYSWNGGVYTTSGIYTWTGTNQDGCDSTVALNIHINNSTFSNSLAVSCDSYTFNDTIYTSTGTHIWKTTNSAGCDSTHTLNLIINKRDTTTSTQTACDNYIWEGTTYTTSGLYTKSYTAFTGCDSIHTLNLIINKRDTTTNTETACDNYIWDGTTYTSSGVYTKGYTSVEGCDSAHILNLTINNSSFTTSSAVSCDGYTWNANTYYNTGTYVWTTTNSAGCDSVATLNLIINQVYAEITQSGETLSASTNPPGLNADWYNIQTENGNTRIWLMEEDTSSFTPTFDCSYFIVVRDNGCTDTSDVLPYGATAARIGSFVTSPNPTKGLVNVKFQNNNNQIVVFDLITNSGVKLDEFITIEDNLDIDLSKYPSGTYYLYFNSEEAIQGCRLEESQKTSTKIILNK
ncbi:MAG: hypothetical protein CMD14_04360 [Flavobacteriales bacterium]|nr:hypothetical protein [Flavobacteriales bacterium]|tara:strand:+ start:2150 stop:5599 length:3450 start_codon:yes stop_codon:yes gene_type:complete